MVNLTIDFELQNFTYVWHSDDLLVESVSALVPHVVAQLPVSLELLVAVDANVQVQQDHDREVHERELRQFGLGSLVADVERPVSLDVGWNIFGFDRRLDGPSCLAERLEVGEEADVGESLLGEDEFEQTGRLHVAIRSNFLASEVDVSGEVHGFNLPWAEAGGIASDFDGVLGSAFLGSPFFDDVGKDGDNSSNNDDGQKLRFGGISAIAIGVGKFDGIERSDGTPEYNCLVWS